ncbi:aldose 1-epimerase family protein [Saccharopolyspora sp. CA-218241]|uniref:aldose 1-epimerase family protein n=1 Tax=Saccharopolyspora sp. CA-218241 TaxID=3240027 RepID=UPI003D98D2B3
MREPASGQQFEITAGAARAVITEVGAALREFEVDGVPFAEPYAADRRPPASAGAVLAPWPNRVAGGRWVLDGEPQQLALTEPTRGNALHGLLCHVPWQVEERTAASVRLRAPVASQPGWPVPLVVAVEYAVSDEDLRVTHEVRNAGDRTTPFGVGAHPFPRAGTAATDDCTLRLAASSVLPLDADTLLPARPPRSLAGDELDFRTGRPLAGVWLDTAFGGAAPAPGDDRVRHAITAPDGTAVELWADPVFGWVQVYTADDFPGRGRAVAVEPMTCPPDALNSGIDLLHVEPGETWSGSWGLRAR